MKEINLIIFDLSNVCFSSEEPPFITEFCKIHGLDEGKFDVEYQNLLKRSEVDEISGEDVWNLMLKKYDINGDPKSIITEMMGGKESYADTLKVVKQLKEKGYKVLYLSNYNRDYWSHVIAKFKMDEYFLDGLVSYQIKARKPDKKGFITLMEKYEVLPENTLFIDDSKGNLEEASKLGINTYQFTSSTDLNTFLFKERIL